MPRCLGLQWAADLHQPQRNLRILVRGSQGCSDDKRSKTDEQTTQKKTDTEKQKTHTQITTETMRDRVSRTTATRDSDRDAGLASCGVIFFDRKGWLAVLCIEILHAKQGRENRNNLSSIPGPRHCYPMQALLDEGHMCGVGVLLDRTKLRPSQDSHKPRDMLVALLSLSLADKPRLTWRFAPRGTLELRIDRNSHTDLTQIVSEVCSSTWYVSL